MGDNRKIAKLRRVQRLFTAGDILVVRDEKGEAETFWVCALNAFEEQDVATDAETGKVRAMLRFDASESDQDKVTESMTGMTNEQLAGALVYDKQVEHFNRVRADIIADPEWKERLTALDNQEQDGATEEDERVIQKLNIDFARETAKRKAEMDEDLLAELTGRERPYLEAEYRKSRRAIAGINGYFEYQRRSQVYRALRDCQAVLVEGEWDHAGCNFHQEKVLDSLEDLNLVPNELMVEFNKVWEDLHVTPDDAGKSAAPSASSGSSERQRLAEASTPSTPAETSTEPQPL